VTSACTGAGVRVAVDVVAASRVRATTATSDAAFVTPVPACTVGAGEVTTTEIEVCVVLRLAETCETGSVVVVWITAAERVVPLPEIMFAPETWTNAATA
jgi:hypothetical protein